MISRCRATVCAFIAASCLLSHFRAAAQQWAQSPDVQALYKDAKTEGSVVVWGTHPKEVDWIPAAFGKVFPGIDVQFFGDNDIAVKAIAEARAGRHQLDVYWSSLTGVLPVNQRDLLAVNNWELFGIDKRAIAFDGKMAYTSNIVYVLAYNTKTYKAEDMPADWSGILDEKFKGKSAASTFLLPRLIGALGLAWGEDKALQFARDIVAQTGMMLTRAPRDGLLQSGERTIGFGEIDSLVRTWVSDGLPIQYTVPEPVVLGQFGATVMKNAPHPSAARLLAGYLASAEGRRARELATTQADYGPQSDNPLAKKIYSGQVKVVFDTPEQMVAREALFGRVAAIITGQAR